MTRVRTFVHVMGAEDGRAHLVELLLYEEALTAGAGRYPAACGRTVLAGSLSDAPSGECPLCRAVSRG